MILGKVKVCDVIMPIATYDFSTEIGYTLLIFILKMSIVVSPINCIK